MQLFPPVYQSMLPSYTGRRNHYVNVKISPIKPDKSVRQVLFCNKRMWDVRQLGTKTLKGHGFFQLKNQQKWIVITCITSCANWFLWIRNPSSRISNSLIRFTQEREWIVFIEGTNQQPWERISHWGTGSHNLI